MINTDNSKSDIKLVLFGAGEYGKAMLYCDIGISPSYFVDNNRDVSVVKKWDASYDVKSPKVLMSEDKSKLRIIITSDMPAYSDIEEQLGEMGLAECLLSPIKKCFICKSEFELFLPYGKPARGNALCRTCKSLERHRFLWFYFENNETFMPRDDNTQIKLLHFAPERALFNVLHNNTAIDYYPVDVDPGRKDIREVVDITNMPYPDDFFNVIICNHVLEHIIDEKKALSELKRVLAKKGKGFITVPANDKNETTIENLDYTPEERLKYYGQADHVRVYGRDFPTRLSIGLGLDVEIVCAKDIFTAEQLLKYGIAIWEKIYVY